MFDEWLVAERASRHLGVLGILHGGLRGAFEERSDEDVLAYAAAILAIEPTDEEAHRIVIRHHAKKGYPAAAIQQYRTCAEILRKQLDIDPSPETAALAAQVRVDPPSRFPTLRVTLEACLGDVNTDEAKAVVWDLSSTLARTRWLRVVASGDTSPSADDADRRGYRVRTAVRRTPNGSRIWIELIDVVDGRVLWTELLDCFSPQRLWEVESIARASAAIASHVRLHEARRTDGLREEDLGCEELVHRAVRLIGGISHEALNEAVRLLGRALALDPRSARAHACYAFAQLMRVAQRTATDAAATRQEARHHAILATELGPDDGWSWTVRGHAESFLFDRAPDAVPYFERALRINPSSGLACAFSAMARSYLDDGEKAVEHANRARRLSSFPPVEQLSQLAQTAACMVAGDYSTAVRVGGDAVSQSPDFLATYVPLLASLGRLGRVEEARRCFADLQGRSGVSSQEMMRSLTPLVKRISECARGLDQAGVPRT